MIFPYVTACLWGVVILLALIGWGYFVNALNKKTYSLGILGVLGISFSMAFGGVLNLLMLISKDTIKLYLYMGVFLCLIYLFINRASLFASIQSSLQTILRDKKILLVTVGVFIFLCVRIGLSVSFYGFHGADDNPGYLVFPQKMIQTGGLGDDPFSERRLVSSLGGMYFLHTFVLAELNFKYLHLIDNVIGYVLFFVLALSLMRGAPMHTYLKVLTIIVLLLVASPSWNITSVMISAALFLGLLTFVLHEHKNRYEIFFLVPLVLSALVVTKSNMIIPSGVIAAYYYLDLFVKDFKEKRFSLFGVVTSLATYTLLPLVATIAFMATWMVSLYHSSGTMLYPLLGRGYHGMTYGTFLSHYFSFDAYSWVRLVFELFGSLNLLVPFLMLSVTVLLTSFTSKRSVIAILASVFLGYGALIYATGGYSLYYYSFSFAFSALIFSLISVSYNYNRDKVAIVSWVIVASLFGFHLEKGQDIFQQIKNGISYDGGIKIGLLNADPVSDEELTRYKNLQKSIPEKETIFAVLDNNFLLDFTKNTIYIADSPGAVSLPPGMPMFKGESDLEKYFLEKNITYIACSCGEKAAYSKDHVSGMLKPHVNPWLKTETMNSLDFRDNFQKLALQKKVVYDDGANIVLDLSLPAHSK